MRDDASTKPSHLFLQNAVQVIPSLRHPGHHGCHESRPPDIAASPHLDLDTSTALAFSLSPRLPTTPPRTRRHWDLDPTLDFSPLLQIMLTPEWLLSHSIGLGNLGREWAKRKIYSYDKQSTEKRGTKIPTTRIPIPTQQHDKADNRSWKLLKEIKATSYDVPSQLARQQWKVGTHLYLLIQHIG
ncbi:hypothetical protein ACRE_027130 [Hapsidospora chrysogenum ATCC 11550]|uniref:Uncharacterized protein n=1 Tax=Hapsidospora chrysogenum (strain ATCC 11550 / CBS 779.69 / DSM 880 / IAM 14645 / JCM 23072 / IMI 49137) TaxID=857340 RepID=A0A086TAV2_HAPC1|nr:hypothetical protein ACRE_027130 [Hapsidospora chrysogenum ATCC 11550]